MDHVLVLLLLHRAVVGGLGEVAEVVVHDPRGARVETGHRGLTLVLLGLVVVVLHLVHLGVVDVVDLAVADGGHGGVVELGARAERAVEVGGQVVGDGTPQTFLQENKRKGDVIDV